MLLCFTADEIAVRVVPMTAPRILLEPSEAIALTAAYVWSVKLPLAFAASTCLAPVGL
jgi:hypothetical protein